MARKSIPNYHGSLVKFALGGAEFSKFVWTCTNLANTLPPYMHRTILTSERWMFAWNSSQLKLSNVFVVVNSLSQLYFIFTKLGPMNTSSTSSILTHINAKTFAGIGVLDFVHNLSVAYYKDVLPTTAVKVVTGAGFAGLAACSDWIFGGCLVYDLVALSVGQAQLNNPDWSKMLGGFAVATAGIVGLRNYFM